MFFIQRNQYSDKNFNQVHRTKYHCSFNKSVFHHFVLPGLHLRTTTLKLFDGVRDKFENYELYQGKQPVHTTKLKVENKTFLRLQNI